MGPVFNRERLASLCPSFSSSNCQTEKLPFCGLRKVAIVKRRYRHLGLSLHPITLLEKKTPHGWQLQSDDPEIPAKGANNRDSDIQSEYLPICQPPSQVFSVLSKLSLFAVPNCQKSTIDEEKGLIPSVRYGRNSTPLGTGSAQICNSSSRRRYAQSGFWPNWRRVKYGTRGNVTPEEEKCALF